MTTYRLKKDLPFAKKGAEVLKKEYSSNNYVWQIDGFLGDKKTDVNREFFNIGNQSMDMSEWIEEVEEFDFGTGHVSNFKGLCQGYERIVEKVRNGIFFGNPISKMKNDDLFYVIGYLENLYSSKAKD